MKTTFDIYDLDFEAEFTAEWQPVSPDEGIHAAGWAIEVLRFTVTLGDGNGDSCARFTIEDESAWLSFIAMKPEFRLYCHGKNFTWRAHELPPWSQIIAAAETAAAAWMEGKDHE